ncbi:TetR/AcrR family transcriptional regulator [Streptomyces sp. NPDC047917]|uniref:TetR/AcrR family transcriptional regulator n=1 Tax=Streptomyces sp. NPDC047917 TaxID=3365491 RepID=UPI00371B6071
MEGRPAASGCEEGVTRPGIADLMKEAGLTHGGFYKHFASRDELIAQASELALTEGTANMEQAAHKNEEAPRSGVIDAYLAERHRESPGTGCALVTLSVMVGAMLMARATADRDLSDELLKTVANQLERRTPGSPATAG